RCLPGQRAGTNSGRARGKPPSGRRPAAAPEKGGRANSLLRDPARIDRSVQLDSRGEDVADSESDSDRPLAGNDLDGSVAGRARQEGDRRAGRGTGEGVRSGDVQVVPGRSCDFGRVGAAERPPAFEPERTASLGSPADGVCGAPNDKRKVKKDPPP